MAVNSAFDFNLYVQFSQWSRGNSSGCGARDPGFVVWLWLSCCCVFHFLSKKTLFVMKFCKSFCNVNSFSMLNILQYLWLIIRVSKYRPTVFKRYQFWDHLYLRRNSCSYCFPEEISDIYLTVISNTFRCLLFSTTFVGTCRDVSNFIL